MLALISNGQALARVIFRLPNAGDLEAHAFTKRREFRSRRGRIQPVEQILCDVLLLAQDGAARRLGRMAHEYRLNAHRTDQFECALECHAITVKPHDAIGNTAGLRRARIIEVFAPTPYAVNFFRRVHRLKPNGKRARQVRRSRRRAP